MNKLNRRDFAKLSTHLFFGLSGLLGLGGLLRFFSFQPDLAQPAEFDLGGPDDYPLGAWVIRADIPAVIHNEDGEIMAFSLTCTHLGCTVEADEEGNGFAYPCHGSRYDADGNILHGPAQKPLRKLRIELLADRSLKLTTGE